MKCNYCGFESENNFIFCPNCGKEAPVEVYGDENPAANHILSVLKDKLFFALCILLTVGSCCSLLAGNINVISILATIFIWFVYNASIKNIADSKNLRYLSGTTYAYYVVMSVSAIIVAVCMAIALLFSGFLLSSSFILEEISEIFGAFSFLVAASPTLIFITGIAIAALMFLLSVFGLRNIHAFVKTVYQSVESGVIAYEKCKSAETWLMIFGILSAISSLSSLGSPLLFCSSASFAAVEIIASLLIKKHFSSFD